ncbi:MAG: hypothetical protein BJ554DRAFT_2998 [Olpidium bornovanus]|uniref:Uncharacterized protein n=1 Tax=Olpidium bornovanus TaxID=278681 RepID=A0A8H7ZPZ0_9FUNG|nr:MAG: hypothetical protein BJ554DRAFT_2998 [Olpidium bornovanus]
MRNRKKPAYNLSSLPFPPNPRNWKTHARLEEDTAVCVNVGVGVLGFAVLGEHAGRNLVDLTDEAEQGVIWKVLHGELALTQVARVGAAEYSVTVAGHNLAGFESLPQVLFNARSVDLGCAQLFFHFHDPAQHLLVGKAMQRPSKAVKPSRERQVGVRKCGPDKVCRVRRDVPALVVGVNRQVEPHQLNKFGIDIEAQQTSEICRVVEVRVHGGHFSVLVHVAVDTRRYVGQFRDQIHRVLVRVVPVLGFVDSGLVRSREGRIVLQRIHSN